MHKHKKDVNIKHVKKRWEIFMVQFDLFETSTTVINIQYLYLNLMLIALSFLEIFFRFSSGLLSLYSRMF